jgi:hypothetical protein
MISSRPPRDWDAADSKTLWANVLLPLTANRRKNAEVAGECHGRAPAGVRTPPLNLHCVTVI